MASSSAGSQNNFDIQIPGFFYDPITRRYFKILNDSNSATVSNCVTRKTVNESNAAITRQEMIDKLVRDRQSERCSRRKSRNIVHNLDDLQRGGINRLLAERLIRLNAIRSVHPEPRMRHSTGPEKQQLLHLQLVNDRLFSCTNSGVDRVSLSSVQLKYNVITASDLNAVNARCRFRRKSCYMSIPLPYWTKFICADSCRKASSNTCPYNKIAIVQEVKDLGHIGTFLYRINFETYVHISTQMTKFPVITCLDFYCEDKFLAGLENGVGLGVVSDGVRVSDTHYQIARSRQVLAVKAYRETPCVFLTATSGDQVLIYDERVSRHDHCIKLNKISACDLYVSQDKNHLITPTLSGKMDVYDIRMIKSKSACRSLTESPQALYGYEGHVNNHVITRCHVDENEDILYSVGSDGVTRVWDYRTQELLKTLPPPRPNDPSHLPIALYHPTLVRSRPGFIIGVADQLVIHSI